MHWLLLTTADEQSVRVINTAQSPEIAPQGGTVDFVVQMGLPAELGNSNSGSSSNSSSSSGRRTRVSPGVASVYLNGEYCMYVLAHYEITLFI